MPNRRSGSQSDAAVAQACAQQQRTQKGCSTGKATGPLPLGGLVQRQGFAARLMGAVPGTAKETRTQRQGAWKRANCGNGTSACQAHVVRSCGCSRTEREGKKDDPALRENPKKAERAHEDFRPQGWSSKGRERRKDAVSSGFGLSECQQRRQWGPAAMPTPILFLRCSPGRFACPLQSS